MTNQVKIHVMVQETVHQWFGNLATTDNWGDIWLNEGITTYLECLVHKKLGFDKTGFVRYSQMALNSEQHPIVFQYDSDTPIFNEGIPGSVVFVDSVIYQKASLMIKLFADPYTEDWTRDVLRRYLLTLKGKNAITEDFLRIVESMTGNSTNEVTPVEFLKDWLYQIGNPVLRVSRLNGTHIWVDKTPVIKGNYKLKSNSWSVPVLYRRGNKIQMEWLGKNGILEIELPVNSSIILNPNNDSPYHVLFAKDVKTEKVSNKDFYICNVIENTAANQRYCNDILSRKHIYGIGRTELIEKWNETNTLQAQKLTSRMRY